MERDRPNRRPRALRPDLEEEERNAITKARRSHGTGSLYVHAGRNGRESWYARWYVAGKRVRRTLGLKRGRSQLNGLTRSEAEAELRRLIQSEIPIPARITVAEASERMLASLRTLGRKPTTLDTYRSTLEIHLLPRMGAVPMSEVGPGDVEAVLAAMERKGNRRRPEPMHSDSPSSSSGSPSVAAGAHRILARHWSRLESNQTPTSASSTKRSSRHCSTPSTPRRTPSDSSIARFF